METKVSLAAPWITYYHKMMTFFEGDPEVTLVYDEDNATLKLYVDNAEKAEALGQLIPDRMGWGKIIMNIQIIPSNKKTGKYQREDIFHAALDGNAAFAEARTLDYDEMSNPMTFVVFKPIVAQYYDDNMASLTGLSSCLYEDLARDLFVEMDGVYYSTQRK